MNRELLIFGANGALGKGITRTLLKKGYSKNYLFDHHIGENDFNTQNILNIRVGDLSNEESVIEAFEKIEPSKNKLFFLFSTIGGYDGGKEVYETGIETLDKMFKINLKTNFLIAKHFSVLVKKSGGGSACFTSALVSINHEPNKAAYAASKNALNSLVQTLALEGAAYNLSVNAIAPYIIDTEPNREWMKNADFEKWIKPEEVGELVDAIFSNFHYVTGNILELSTRFSISI